MEKQEKWGRIGPNSNSLKTKFLQTLTWAFYWWPWQCRAYQRLHCWVIETQDKQGHRQLCWELLPQTPQQHREDQVKIGNGNSLGSANFTISFLEKHILHCDCLGDLYKKRRTVSKGSVICEICQSFFGMQQLTALLKTITTEKRVNPNTSWSTIHWYKQKSTKPMYWRHQEKNLEHSYSIQVLFQCKYDIILPCVTAWLICTKSSGQCVKGQN
jgi:hypothetical protein